MVTVIVRLRLIDLAEQEILLLSDFHPRHGPIAVVKFGGHCHELRIEGANAFRGPDRNLELDIGDAECDAPETRGVRLMAAHPIAPGTYRLDVVVVLAERKFSAVQLLRDGREPVEQ